MYFHGAHSSWFSNQLTCNDTMLCFLHLISGELFTFGYQFQHPYCTYRVVSKDGVMQDEVTITVSGPIMMHDFAITEQYAIFMDMPLYFNPKVKIYFFIWPSHSMHFCHSPFLYVYIWNYGKFCQWYWCREWWKEIQYSSLMVPNLQG